MKKFFLSLITALLALGLLAGCGKTQAEPPVTSEPAAESTIISSEETTTSSEETTTVEDEGAVFSYFVDTEYVQPLEQYYTAISNRWSEGAYFEHEMSPLVSYYYDGNALANVGFAYMDINGDNVQELIIGAIQDAEKNPLVFEIWTLKNGKAEMLVQSGSRNRYYMQYSEEDDMWSVAYEAENGAANHAVHYLQLANGKFEVIQGVVFDAVANESEPWFMTYDLDWDTSNDMAIDEYTANAVTEAGRNIYTALEYVPFSLCKSDKENTSSTISAKDCFDDAGFIKFIAGADKAAEYIFTAENSSNVEWSVYVLDEAFDDSFRYIKQVAEPVLIGNGTVSVYEGQYVYVYCSANEFTTGTVDENAKLNVTVK